MTLLGKLPNLKGVKLHRDNSIQTNVDYFKFLQKGMSYMAKDGHHLEMIQFENLLTRRQAESELLFSILKHHPNLICLKINRGSISMEDAKAIGKILADFKCVRELDVSNCGLDTSTTKEIADGLMRAK